jgi:hypothetical protein
MTDMNFVEKLGIVGSVSLPILAAVFIVYVYIVFRGKSS